MVKRLPQRRFSDQVRAAFHEACDEGDVILAEALLRQMEQVIDKPLRLPTGLDRRRPEPLIAPAERLMNLLLWRGQTAGAEAAYTRQIRSGYCV